MPFRIGFAGETTPEGARRGEITLGARAETFATDRRLFTPDRCQRQWRRALETALFEREIAAQFSSPHLDPDGVGQFWL